MSGAGVGTPEGEPEVGEKVPLVEPAEASESSESEAVVLETEVVAADDKLGELSLELGSALGSVEALFHRERGEITCRRQMSWELVGEDDGWVIHAEVAFHTRRKPKT